MFRVLLPYVSILFLSACVEPSHLSRQKPSGTGGYSDKKVSSEMLLNVKGHWNLVDKNQSYDPAKAHLQARKKVNVKRRGKKKELLAHFEPDAKSGQDGRMRVLRLEPQSSGLPRKSAGYELAGSNVVKPKTMVAGKKMLKQVAELVKSSKSKGHGFYNGSIITPPKLPERKKMVRVSAAPTLAPVASAPVASVFVPIPAVKPDLVAVNSDYGDIVIPQIKPKIKPNIKPNIKGKSLVTKLRAAVHSGNNRVVIEVSHTTKYKITIDGLRNVFRVKMENTRWNIAPKGNIKGGDLFGTYITREQENGSILLEIRLKKDAKIIDSMVLSPNKDTGYRIVIDLKAI